MVFAFFYGADREVPTGRLKVDSRNLSPLAKSVYWGRLKHGHYSRAKIVISPILDMGK